jgi:hypothetical protein
MDEKTLLLPLGAFELVDEPAPPAPITTLTASRHSQPCSSLIPASATTAAATV